MFRSPVARVVDFDLLYEPLARDIASSLAKAIAAGVAFDGGDTPLEIFRHAVDGAIRDIQTHPRGELLLAFITRGPYECEGALPSQLERKRLTDDETAKAIRFVFSWMVNSFQGRLAELLAAGPMLDVLEELKSRHEVPATARMFVGDAVTAMRGSGSGRIKAADLHILSNYGAGLAGPRIRIHALGEIKSYPTSPRRIHRQLAGHVTHCRRGLLVEGESAMADDIVLDPEPPIRLWAQPATWTLSRGFRFEEADGRVVLHVDPPQPPMHADEAIRLPDGCWRLTLRWSHEALAAAAFAMTFWYMDCLGEVAFADPSANPWPKMSPAEAGRNAATRSLYYAILRARSKHESDRAVALYNTYGFGYALGMNFRRTDGRRRMLWPVDLREILVNGVSRDGARIVG